MNTTAGHEPRISATVNQNASPVGNLPAIPLQWKVVTSAVNTEDSTMSTLYGNDVAAGYARTNSQHNYPNGSMLSLVTWTQREDDRWFGAAIPDQVKSVEFVSVGVAPDDILYDLPIRRYRLVKPQQSGFVGMAVVAGRFENLLYLRGCLQVRRYGLICQFGPNELNAQKCDTQDRHNPSDCSKSKSSARFHNYSFNSSTMKCVHSACQIGYVPTRAKYLNTKPFTLSSVDHGFSRRVSGLAHVEEFGHCRSCGTYHHRLATPRQ
jgi:hypothetical protein